MKTGPGAGADVNADAKRALCAAAAALAVALATAAMGCGSSSSGPSASTACMDIATRRCNERSMCSLAGGSSTMLGANLAKMYGDMPTCIARETLACENGLAAPHTGQSPSKVEACVVAFATYSCQDYFDNNPPADCVVTGALANGVQCAFGGQCASGFCDGTKNSACGVCADAPVAGTDCSASTCTHNQRCVSADMTCEDVVSMNGACDSTHPCDNGLACVGDTATTMGTCQTAGTRVGAACGAGMPSCDGTLGLFCGGAAGAKTCMAITYVGDGSPCGTMSDGSRVGCAAGDCYTATGLAGSGDMGICKAAVRESAAAPGCDTVLGPGCLAPARCVIVGTGSAGTCIVPTGAMCPS